MKEKIDGKNKFIIEPIPPTLPHTFNEKRSDIVRRYF